MSGDLASNVAAAEQAMEAAMRAAPERVWRGTELAAELRGRWPATVAMIALHHLLNREVAVADSRWFLRLNLRQDQTKGKR